MLFRFGRFSGFVSWVSGIVTIRAPILSSRGAPCGGPIIDPFKKEALKERREGFRTLRSSGKVPPGPGRQGRIPCFT